MSRTLRAQLLVASILPLLACPGRGFAQQIPASVQPLVKELDDAATKAVHGTDSAGLTLGVVTREGLVWTKSYGFADIEKQTPASADTIYRIGSITKQFTALMLLQLVHAGKVHVNDPVEKYFPEINLVPGRDPSTPPITLEQLARQTSGLDPQPGDTVPYSTGPVSDWEKTLVAALPHTKYIARPGEKWSPSNIGYAILGATLSRVVHQPYADYVKQHILAPLGMSHSDFEATPAIRKTLAVGYVSDYKGKMDPTLATKEHNAGRGYNVPNGALYTTVGDLARFEVFEMLNGPQNVLRRKELQENFKHRMPADPAQHSEGGLGFSVIRPDGTDSTAEFIGHGGGIAGYTAAAFFEPHANVGVVILRNALDSEAEKVLDIFIHSRL